MSIHGTALGDGKPLTITVGEAQLLSRLGPTKLWELIGNGTLQSVRIGRRRLVIYASLCRLLTPDDPAQPRGRGRPRKVAISEATK
jgi:hypothetical protein